MTKNWYQSWFNSSFYHKLYFERDEKEATAFITNLLKFLNPPTGSKMLDVACGRGRHSITLAEYGFSVTGLDISEKSIAFANQYKSETLEFFQHDMRHFFRKNYYNYAFNIFTSMGYFDSRKEDDDAMHTIAESLKPNGYFIIDFMNVDYVEKRLITDEEQIIDDTHYKIHRWQTSTHFLKRIQIADPSLPTPMEHTEKVQKFRLADFSEMLQLHKLKILEIFGDYQLQLFDINNSPRLILITQKQN